MAQPEPLLDIDATADYFKTTDQALYQQRFHKKDPGNLAIKVGRHLRWRRSTLDAWVEQQEAASRPTLEAWVQAKEIERGDGE